MSAEAVRVVEQIQEALGMDDVVAAIDDDEKDSRVRRTLMELADPSFEVAMIGPAYLAATVGHPGWMGSATRGSTGRAPSRATASISSA